jgi:hypothetical protein
MSGESTNYLPKQGRPSGHDAVTVFAATLHYLSRHKAYRGGLERMRKYSQLTTKTKFATEKLADSVARIESPLTKYCRQL